LGFAGGLAEEVAGIIMRIVLEIFSAFASLASKLTLKAIDRREDPRETASRAEFEAKNPLANPKIISNERHGVFFGAQYGKYVIKSENIDGHVMVVGSPGTGKSSCIAIPTLRGWKGSVFAVDIKGELYANAHEQRKNVKVFAPQDKNNRYVYDPYVFLKESENPAQEARAIAQAVIPLPFDTKEPFWIESAQLILTGAILHYHHTKCSFIETLLRIQSQSPQSLIKAVIESPNKNAQLCVNSFVDMEGKTLAGISAEISRAVTTIVTDNELVIALSQEESTTNSPAKETISPFDLESGHDIYIKIPEHLLRQWKNLLALLVNQFITFFERRDESYSRPILFLLDEFPRLGKIPAITDALATLRAKKVTICLIVQSLAQLDMIYGHDTRKVISDTCAYKAVLGATDADTQEYFSKLVGTYEKIRNSQSRNYDPYVGAPTGHGTQTSQDYEKRIIKPEEFATLQEIILLYPMPRNFCRVKKRPFYSKTE
jgi:type IV secretion system protein VirD4